MATKEATVRVGIYLRISRDAEGKALGVERQREDCLKKAADNGWTVAAIYDDNDRSASTISTKPRPHYAQMLEDVRAGKLDAILAYSNSRFTRRALEFRDLIKLVQETGVTVETVVSGRANFNTVDGRMVAKIMAEIDEAEAERIQERVLRKHEQLRESGAMIGARSFGFAVDGAGRLTGTHVPEEAALIREAAQRILSGEGLSKIAESWNAQGATSTRGAEWDHRNLRTLLRNPKLAGFRVHGKQIVRDDAGDPVRGQWEPILSPEEWTAVRRLIDAKKNTREGGIKHPLGGILKCECGGVMWGMTCREKSGAVRLNYACRECRTTVAHAKVHPAVWKATAESLLYGAEGGDGTPDASAALHARVEALREAKSRLVELVTEHGWDPADITVKRVALDDEIEAVEQELNALAAQDTSDRVLTELRRSLWEGPVTFAKAAEVRSALAERIAAMPMDKQRTLVRGSLEVTVRKVGKGNVKAERVAIRHLLTTSLNESVEAA